MSVNPYLDQPIEIAIETLALCNARCTFCPYPTLDRKGTKMDDKLILSLMEQMSTFKYPFTFSPFKVNEPFLDDRLMWLLRIANKNIPNMQLRLFTNGSPLTHQLIAEIADLERVAHLWVSLNSSQPDEYQRIMGLRFEHTAKKLDMLHQHVVGATFTHPVILSKVTQNVNHDGDFLNYCSDRWPCFRTTLIKQDSWLGYVAPLNPTVPDLPCARWFELSITATGIASLCCMDGSGQFALGSVHEHTLLEIYNAPAYRERREKSLSRKLIHPCNTCSY